jgi:hypothetical protein
VLLDVVAGFANDPEVANHSSLYHFVLQECYLVDVLDVVAVDV